MKKLRSLLSLFFCAAALTPAGETLNAEKVPTSYDELWADIDPQAEPLDVEVLQEWEEDGVVLKVLRYRIGVFKGQTSVMAGVYGYPKGGEHLPGLVNIHGGGQYADYRSVLTNAKRGYATITISWAGRIAAPKYRVSPNEVKLFWEGKTEDPAYKLTTDWGALDGYHAPSRNGKDAFVSIPTAPWTFDSVPSPRNNSWFLATLGARRALTFLEQQPEVDGSKLGVYGHSMGGKLTVLTTAADSRVKAAAPSCGGISDRRNENPLHRTTVGDATSLKRISVPTIFLSPSNDFHGSIDDLILAIDELKTDEWRVTCSPHTSHQDLPENEVATLLWFDQHLKGTFACPETPKTTVVLKTDSGVPAVTVTPDTRREIERVDVFYTQQGIKGGDRTIRNNRVSRFWHHAAPSQHDDQWKVDLPLFSTDQPLWVYANVLYKLDEPVTGAGYYYESYTTDSFNLSSLLEIIAPETLQAAGVQATMTATPLIESFEGEWENEWFTYKPADWARKTHKVYHPRWAAPEGAELEVEVRADEVNTLVLGMDGYAAEVEISGGGKWNRIQLSSAAFQDAEGTPMPGWGECMEFRYGASETLKTRNAPGRQLGGAWNGMPPEFRNLRWVVE